MITRALALGALAMLAAPASAQKVPGAGAGVANMEAVGAVFAEVCVKGRPSYGNAAAALSQFGFKVHAGSGGYYHPAADISVTAGPSVGCTVVARFSKDQTAALEEFAAAVRARSGGKTANVDLKFEGVTGAAYIIARIK